MSTQPQRTDMSLDTVGPRAQRLPEAMNRIVRAACRAPSVHNSQPWFWRLGDDTVELLADRSRQLVVTDPTGRNLTMSCGAALHHVQVAAAALGYETRVDRLPDVDRPDLLARVQFSPGSIPADAEVQLAAIADRCTDRRRFTSWPIPDERLEQLAGVARAQGAAVIPLTEVGTRIRAELLVNRALEIQRREPEVAWELSDWVERADREGVPLGVIPDLNNVRGERPTRFDPDSTSASISIEGTDSLIVIATAWDDPISWLQAGESLSALWLYATVTGLSVVPLSQVIEVEETREALMRDVLGGLGVPQLLLRIGWQEIGRATLPRTPRRRLDDVIVP